MKKTDHLPGYEIADEFFGQLYPENVPAGLHQPIWTLADKRTAWCDSTSAAAMAAVEAGDRSDVYFGVSLQDRDAAIAAGGQGTRGTSATAGGIAALWADVDVFGPNHKAENLPPTIDDALGLLDRLGLPPSVIVRTGGGLQAYWFLVEPWIFDDDADRQRAAALAASWVGTLQAHAAVHGWKVDSTKDLARVMRVPGTCNRKGGGAVPVTMEVFGHRYNPDDFEPHLAFRVPPIARQAAGSKSAPGEPANEVDLFRAESCFKALSAARADDRDDWIRFGMVAKSLRRDDQMLPAWLAWSSLSPKYDEADARATWDSLKPADSITLGSLIFAAKVDCGGIIAGVDDDEIGSALQRASRGSAAPPPAQKTDAGPSPVAPPPMETASIPSGGGPTNGTHAKPSKPMPPGARVRVANMVDRTLKDEKGNDRRVKFYAELPDIASTVTQAAGGWPRRVGGLLFVPTEKPSAGSDLPGQGGIQYLPKVDDLFAWMQKRCDVRWGTGDVVHAVTGEQLTAPTKGEFAAYLKDNVSPCYRSAETLPHVPQIKDVFYIPCPLPTVDHSDLTTPLWELVSRFNPETEDDRMLMLAALMTPGWGGPAGTRPAFVFTSTHGMGVGKSATASVLAEIWGGAVGIGANEDWDQVKKRLLSDDSLSKRICIIDNLKGKLSGGDIEGAITAKELDGWKPYHGQASRPNFLTWFLTANSPSLSRDLATRSIIIRLGAQKHGEDFIGWAEKFIPANRAAILSEIFEKLAGPPKCMIARANRDRWGGWQDGVLSKLDRGNELAALVAGRRPDVDSDLDDSDDIAKAVYALVEEAFPDFETRRVFITRRQLFNRLQAEGVTDKSMGPKAVTSWVRNHCGAGRLKCFGEHRIATGRGWLFTGSEAAPKGEISEVLDYSGQTAA
jgi:hypothetical protein